MLQSQHKCNPLVVECKPVLAPQRPKQFTAQRLSESVTVIRAYPSTYPPRPLAKILLYGIAPFGLRGFTVKNGFRPEEWSTFGEFVYIDKYLLDIARIPQNKVRAGQNQIRNDFKALMEWHGERILRRIGLKRGMHCCNCGEDTRGNINLEFDNTQSYFLNPKDWDLVNFGLREVCFEDIPYADESLLACVQIIDACSCKDRNDCAEEVFNFLTNHFKTNEGKLMPKVHDVLLWECMDVIDNERLKLANCCHECGRRWPSTERMFHCYGCDQK